VIDVTGPASADDVTADDVTAADDVTLVHVSDVRSLLTSVYHNESDELSSTLPLVVYVRANETEAGQVGHFVYTPWFTRLLSIALSNTDQFSQLLSLAHATDNL